MTDIFDYSEELEALKRVEIGMEEVLGIKHPNLSDSPSLGNPLRTTDGEKDIGAGQAKAKELSRLAVCVDYYFQY